MRSARCLPLVVAALAAATAAACGGGEAGDPSSLGRGARPAASSGEAACREAMAAVCGYYLRCHEQAVAMCMESAELGRELCEMFVEQYLEEYCSDTRELCDGAEIQGMDTARIRALTSCVDQLSCSEEPAKACGDEPLPEDLDW